MSLNNKSVSFIGAGNMAEALIRGLLTAGTVAPEQVVATDIRADRLDQLKQQYGIGIETDNAVAASRADIMILAVKPQQMSEVLASLNPPIGKSKLVVSIAAGVPTGRIEQELGGDARVVRVMPNTPALVGEGAARPRWPPALMPARTTWRLPRQSSPRWGRLSASRNA